jgi:hypothetical protein
VRCSIGVWVPFYQVGRGRGGWIGGAAVVNGVINGAITGVKEGGG